MAWPQGRGQSRGKEAAQLWATQLPCCSNSPWSIIWTLVFCSSFQEKLCLPHHILEEKGLVKVGMTVQALLDVTVTKTLFTWGPAPSAGWAQTLPRAGASGLCSWHLYLLPHSPPASSLTSYVDKTSAEGRIRVLLELVSRVQVGQVLSDSQWGSWQRTE